MILVNSNLPLNPLFANSVNRSLLEKLDKLGCFVDIDNGGSIGGGGVGERVGFFAARKLIP